MGVINAKKDIYTYTLTCSDHNCLWSGDIPQIICINLIRKRRSRFGFCKIVQSYCIQYKKNYKRFYDVSFTDALKRIFNYCAMYVYHYSMEDSQSVTVILENEFMFLLIADTCI